MLIKSCPICEKTIRSGNPDSTFCSDCGNAVRAFLLVLEICKKTGIKLSRIFTYTNAPMDFNGSKFKVEIENE